jgi:hypothetical protein
MQELLPLLQEISSDHPESSVQEMATDIRIAIATHGAVWSELSKEKSQNFEDIAKKVTIFEANFHITLHWSTW